MADPICPECEKPVPPARPHRMAWIEGQRAHEACLAVFIHRNKLTLGPPLVMLKNRKLMTISPWGQDVLRITEQQINDGSLWFLAPLAVETYLQHALRHLHAVIEQETCPECRKTDWSP